MASLLVVEATASVAALAAAALAAVALAAAAALSASLCSASSSSSPTGTYRCANPIHSRKNLLVVSTPRASEPQWARPRETKFL